MNLLIFYLVFLISCTLTLVQAQGIYIASPEAGAVVRGGEKITVQVAKNNHIIASTEVGVAIGIKACERASLCATPEDQLGTVLYVGPFDPQQHGPGPLYQNFTVMVPSDNSLLGPANLNVVRFFLIGAGPISTFQSTSTPVDVRRP